MKIRYLSDLHTEFLLYPNDFFLPVADADIIVLAGDIGHSCQQTLDWLLAKTEGKTTIFCPGNHEAYGITPEEMIHFWQKGLTGTHIHLLANTAVTVEGVRFVGGTLWSDFRVYGEENREMAIAEAASQLSDYREICWKAQGQERGFTPEDAVALNNETSAFLQKTLAIPFSGKTVVVTHHAPLKDSIPESDRQWLYSAAFASDCKAIMLKYQPDIWIHGHLHCSLDYRLGHTRVLCNARGYEAGDFNRYFNPTASVKL